MTMDRGHMTTIHGHTSIGGPPRVFGYTRRDARLLPFPPGPNGPRGVPLPHGGLLPRAPLRRSRAPLPAHGHPGQGHQRDPTAPGLQRSARRAVHALRRQRRARGLRRVAALPARRAPSRARAPPRHLELGATALLLTFVAA